MIMRTIGDDGDIEDDESDTNSDVLADDNEDNW